MSAHACADWRPVRGRTRGLFPDTDREWDGNPAWDLTAVYDRPDALVSLPEPATPEEGEKRAGLFVNRNLDRRFRIEYRLAERDRPRTSTPAIADPAREWDILLEHRDRYLREAGLTLDSPARAITRCLADTFLCDRHFKDKPLCGFYPSEPRNLIHPLDGLLYKSFCVGCATAFAALAQSCGLKTRNLGVGAHWVAEVFVDGHWRYVENMGRHDENRGIGAYFDETHMWLCAHPGAALSAPANRPLRQGFWRRPNAQYHNFALGAWQDPATLRLATVNVHALYPEEKEWFVRAESGNQLPILRTAGGFYHSGAHESRMGRLAELRAAALPDPRHPSDPAKNTRDYLYHPLRTGEKLRVSFWLDEDPGPIREIRGVIPFAAVKSADFSPRAGQGLVLGAGSSVRTLADLGAWPPADPGTGAPLTAAFALPIAAFARGTVNWLTLENRTGSDYLMPFVPNALQPYLPPLWGRKDS